MKQKSERFRDVKGEGQYAMLVPRMQVLPNEIHMLNRTCDSQRTCDKTIAIYHV